MSEKSFVMTNGATHTITEQLKKPNKVIFQCDDGHVLEFNSYEEIYDRLNKLAMMEQKFEVGVKPYIPTQINRTNDVYCGHCNSRFNGTVDYVKMHQKYCPTCGTKLRSDEE